MAEAEERPTDGMKHTDAAALAAGGVATVLATYLDEGEYDLVGFIISVTITWTLISYLLGERKSPSQRWAFAGVIGLTVMPAFGFIFELMFSDNPCGFFTWEEEQNSILPDRDSAVGSIPLLLTWFATAIAAHVLDAKTYRKRNPLP